MSRVNPGGLPGIQAKVETVEKQVWWGHENLRILDPMPIIGSAAVDAGNTPTTNLRAGLIMAKKTSDSLWYPYDGTSATAGISFARGVLLGATQMINPATGAVADKRAEGGILIGGLIKAGQLINLDSTVRRHMASRFIFDDNVPGLSWPWRAEVAKTADYVIVAADNLTFFTTLGAGGAVNFTLPALAKGLRFKFYNRVGQTMTVTSAEGDNIVLFNDLAADSISFATAGEKIGAVAEVYSNAAGDAWYVEIPCKHTLTVAT